jgi:hypothetical protein
VPIKRLVLWVFARCPADLEGFCLVVEYPNTLRPCHGGRRSSKRNQSSPSGCGDCLTPVVTRR